MKVMSTATKRKTMATTSVAIGGRAVGLAMLWCGCRISSALPGVGFPSGFAEVSHGTGNGSANSIFPLFSILSVTS